MDTPNPDPQKLDPKAAKAYGYLIAIVILFGIVFWKACGSHSKPVNRSGDAPAQASTPGK